MVILKEATATVKLCWKYMEKDPYELTEKKCMSFLCCIRVTPHHPDTASST